MTSKLKVPANSIVALSPGSPGPDTVENAWQLMHDDWLSNRVFKSTTTLLTSAARLGTSSSISPGAL